LLVLLVAIVIGATFGALVVVTLESLHRRRASI
jgi:hypothetical protein